MTGSRSATAARRRTISQPSRTPKTISCPERSQILKEIYAQVIIACTTINVAAIISILISRTCFKISDIDLNKCGVYRYAESPVFEILLFGYSIDGGAVTVIDLVQGEIIPEEILDALTGDAVTKWAFNANFERVCLSRYLRDLGRSLDPFHDKHPLSTEMAIQEKLSGFPVSDAVWDEYHIDQEINDRGVRVDRQLVENAIAMDGRSRRACGGAGTAAAACKVVRKEIPGDGKLRLR